jgi:hypothetical protein
VIAFALDWAAGVLIGILATLIVFVFVSARMPEGVEQLRALARATTVAWGAGAALGVWLSSGRPFAARALILGALASVLGCGLLMLPTLLELDSELLRGLASVAALLLVPALARLVVVALKPQT